MSFRGQPQTIDEVVAWMQEQLRSVQAPMAAGTFIGPKGDQGDQGPTGLTGPVGPPDPDIEVLHWATVAP